MKKRDYWLLWITGLVILIGIGTVQSAPGYMDAEYYFSMGLRIANREGFSEPFVWNYLHDTRTVPHPGFTYWQPLPALVAAAGIAISQSATFLGAKLGFLLIASLIPVVTLRLGWEITRNRKTVILAGLLSLFPVLYLPFLGTTDAFGLMMVVGTLYLVAISKRSASPGFLVLAGVSAGLIHLTRSDGLIWVVMGLLVCVLDRKRPGRRAGIFFLGYLAIMGPWFARNWIVLGELLPSGTGRMFWLREYNELFKLRPEELNAATWMEQGIQGIFENISHAIGANLKTVFLVQGQLILAPLLFIGYWNNRDLGIVQAGGLLFGFLFALMTFVFPFAGWRGGFFHAGAGLQPFIWVLIADGFDFLIEFGVKRRGWKRNRAQIMFGSGLVMVLAAATGYVYWDRVIGESYPSPAWERSQDAALLVDSTLDQLGIADDEWVMINNPPGLYAASGRSSIVIPFGPVEDLLAAMEKFDVRYLVLEPNHSDLLQELYADPGGNSALEWIYDQGGTHYFYFPGDLK